MSPVADWFAKAINEGRWGDLASVIGFPITLVGFGITIIQIARTRTATEQISDAVLEIRTKVSLQLLELSLSGLIHDLEEIKQLHRLRLWEAMPPRYAAVRRNLFTVKGSDLSLSDDHKALVQGVIQQIDRIEKSVEDALVDKGEPENVAQLNRLATKQMDKLTGLLVTIQQTRGVSK